jgi:hypothetical protein
MVSVVAMDRFSVFVFYPAGCPGNGKSGLDQVWTMAEWTFDVKRHQTSVQRN